MTSAQQTQYYSFLERQRKQQMMYHSLTSHNIAVIKNAILKYRINPAADATLSAEFWLLVDEFGESLFINELQTLNLTFEDGTLKEITDEK